MNMNLVASLIFGFFGMYFSFMNLLTNLYQRACYKIEESCKNVNSEYKCIPTEEQVKILGNVIQDMKNDKDLGDSNKTRLKYYEINFTRYKLIVNILNFMMFGKFKHVV